MHATLLTSSNAIKKNIVGTTSNINIQKNVGASSSQGFQKKPIFVEKYRQICFLGIPSYPNEIPKGLRDKVTKFARNNVITSEQHLRDFFDLLNDYEVEHEDVVMKLFVHSLTKDARDWFRRLPDDNITSWSDLEKFFKEQYGDHTNAGFILNEFINIKKGQNESTFDFNIRFQEGMYKLFQVMRLEENV